VLGVTKHHKSEIPKSLNEYLKTLFDEALTYERKAFRSKPNVVTMLVLDISIYQSQSSLKRGHSERRHGYYRFGLQPWFRDFRVLLRMTPVPVL
jgi:hypothetical protein